MTEKQNIRYRPFLFPITSISTTKEWKDAVLNEHVLEQLNEIETWIKHKSLIMDDWGLARHLRPGYKALFSGPSGTGKTMAAAIIGRSADKEVYKVDLSLMSTKYIGETEKNLIEIFEKAMDNNWILFFDEADSLFGKRTNVKSAHDRYANMEVAYLLQRIEDYDGVVIVSLNSPKKLDDAFIRRFHSVIHFKVPDAQQRLILWANAFSGKLKLDPSIDLEKIAEDYSLTGGSILNVLRYCAIKAAAENETIVNKKNLITGIRREFQKFKTVELKS